MSVLQRYTNPGLKDDDGIFVRYADHLTDKAAAVESLSRENERLTKELQVSCLAGALAMREKCAQAIEMSPVKAIYECGEHVRRNIKPPSQDEIERFRDKARALLGEKNQGDKEGGKLGDKK